VGLKGAIISTFLTLDSVRWRRKGASSIAGIHTSAGIAGYSAGPGEVITGTASAVLGKRLYAMGGHDDDDNIAIETSAYDPLTRTWIGKSIMHVIRNGAAAGTVRNTAGQSRIIVAGGNEFEPSTEMYTP
jgi:hypothetical protein